jgi:hypothetical protein
MNRTKSMFVIAGAALSLGGQAWAQSAADDQRAHAAELLADAAGRTSQLAQADRRFSVDVHGYFQFRYNWNRRDEVPAGTEDNTIGFQMARTRLNVSGNIVNEDWGYFIQFGADPDGDIFLEDAYGTFRYEGGWQVQFGQFRLPFSREGLVGDQYQLGAERSVTGSIFDAGRTQGLQFGFAGDAFRFAGSFNDGVHASNTDFGTETADWALSGRLEFKWAGDWAQARDLTSFTNSDFFGMFGVAAHWQTGGDTATLGGGTTSGDDLLLATADLSIEGNGWNVFGAVYYSALDVDGGGSFDDLGFVVQGGLFITPQTEIFGRYDMVMPDSGWTNDEDFSTITVGLNHYFVPESHAAKLTIDLQWFLDAPTENDVVNALAAGNTQVGLLADNGDNQWNLRAQLQILF